MRSERWSASKLLWAVVPDVHADNDGVVAHHELERLAALLPHPVHALHCVAMRSGKGPTLVAAVDTKLLEALPDDVGELFPELPPFASECEGVAPRNLLVGAWRPARAVRREQTRRTMLLATISACALLTSAGFFARAALLRTSAHEQHARTSAALHAASDSLQTPEDLRAALEMREEIAAVGREFASRPDLARVLADLLRTWPLQRDANVQSLTIAEDRIDVAVFHRGDYQPWLASVAAPQGWKLEEPRIVAAQGGMRLQFQFVPSPSGAHR